VGWLRLQRQRAGAEIDEALITSGIGGLILAGQVGIGSSATGLDYTLMSITAVVLGGTRIAVGAARSCRFS